MELLRRRSPEEAPGEEIVRAFKRARQAVQQIRVSERPAQKRERPAAACGDAETDNGQRPSETHDDEKRRRLYIEEVVEREVSRRLCETHAAVLETQIICEHVESSVEQRLDEVQRELQREVRLRADAAARHAEELTSNEQALVALEGDRAAELVMLRATHRLEYDRLLRLWQEDVRALTDEMRLECSLAFRGCRISATTRPQW